MGSGGGHQWREPLASDSTVWSTSRPWMPVLDAIDQAMIAATECEQRGQLNQVNPLPGRRRVDTSSGDASLDPWITRSGC